MNNCRAGLYGFAPTSMWLLGTGMASPPFLVMLGLTLPDSRMLNGIASIGLTLPNIAAILPHLRQRILDSLQYALADEQNTRDQINSSDGVNAAQPVDLNVESLTLTSILRDRELQNPPLTCIATVKSVYSAVIEPSESLNTDPEFASHTILQLSAGKTDDDQIFPKIHRSPGVDFSEQYINYSHLLNRESRGPLQIPLPVPDAAEATFFDTIGATLSDFEGCFAAPGAQHNIHEKRLKAEVNGRTGKVIEWDSKLVTADLRKNRSTPVHVDITGILTDALVTEEHVTSTPTENVVRDYRITVAEGTVSPLPDGIAARGDTVWAGYPPTGGKETITKRRPESLAFIPQAVIRRYPSAPLAPAGPYLDHNRQVTTILPHALVHNPVMMLEGTRPRANYTTLEACWRTSSLAEVHPKRESIGGQTFVIETTPTQDPPQGGPASLPEPPMVHKTVLKKHPTHRHRLGVLARAALRDRRYTARRCKSDDIDGSSTSDSDSGSDSGSQYSYGSSADESMFPHMLGTDLIAAIDANSESELNLRGGKSEIGTRLDECEDLLVSEGSAADVSMVMHVSSNDDTPDSEIRAPATSRPLTHEDIQQWASGVVQKCVREVYRNRAPAEPLSPSQTSDICAERPSSSGISRCPLSGLHCKLGAGASGEGPTPSAKGLPTSLQPTSILPNRKPQSVWNLRDIPEFVPRERRVSGTTGRVEGRWRCGMRTTIDVTGDAATEVIARMENQVGFGTRQGLVGLDEKRTVSTASGWQDAQRHGW